MPAKQLVVAFSGHMTDAPNRPSPRFPEARVPAVRARIHGALEKLGASLWGVCSGARGGDQIFARALLDLGGSLTVVLPFPVEGFKQTSVGQGWNDGLDQLLRADRVQVLPPLYQALPVAQAQQNQAFAECNDVIVKTARELAQRLSADSLFLALHHRTNTDARGGTLEVLEQWKRQGGRVEVIDPLE
jgi:hypothetical protein